MDSPTTILKKYWGYDRFRDIQRDIIDATLDGKDTMCILPTGGGKSICYQLPALALEGLVIVISPLIALMNDQVISLQEKGISAATLHSGITKKNQKNIVQRLLLDELDLLYVSPEKLSSESFIDLISPLDISLIAVDEAHCISQWGHDFRPAYLNIASIRGMFPSATIMALTATATKGVRSDIMNHLFEEKPVVYEISARRKNLVIQVLNTFDYDRILVELVTKYTGLSGIVYVRTRREAVKLSELLSQHTTSDFYHGGLSSEERIKKQKAWMKNNTRCMVATNAFGMGIDKSDVRYIIHYGLPGTLEEYVQESGRAGRDMQLAYCYLLTNVSDYKRRFTLLEKSLPEANRVESFGELLNRYKRNFESTDSSVPVDSFNFQKNLTIENGLFRSGLRWFSKNALIEVSKGVEVPSKIKVNRSFDESSIQDIQVLAMFNLLTLYYDDIVHREVEIEESFLAEKSELDVLSVYESLYELDELGAISYNVHEDAGELMFGTDDIKISKKVLNEYSNRRTSRIRQLQSLRSFVKSTHCRQQEIQYYFGEAINIPCGRCDNCYKVLYKDSMIFDQLFNRIVEKLKEKPWSLVEFVSTFEYYERDKVVQVMSMLEGDDRISIDEDRNVIVGSL